jgi:D-sedoheptulose 7-phosphate isomerase
MLTAADGLAQRAQGMLTERNALCERFFAAESTRLAEACREMSRRFQQGGRLLAFGRGPYATDAQHVSVEFVHPVIVGKRALPALDLSMGFQPWLAAILHPHDIVMGFGPPEGDAEVEAALHLASTRGAMTLSLPGNTGSYSFKAATSNPFRHQEMIEMLYHVLWETVHVFLERRGLGQDVGESAFLYPFLGETQDDTAGVVSEVAASIRAKAADDARLRQQVSASQSEAIAATVMAIRRRVDAGGKLVIFGNGGSATDANDWMIDCAMPPAGYRPIPAISLSAEPANITAIANDLGPDVIFLRQLIAHACPEDVAIGISTSGGSKNIIAALAEARRRGMLTVGLLGYDGGEIVRRQLVDRALVVPSDYIPRIQEVQASVYHTVRELLEETHD